MNENPGGISPYESRATTILVLGIAVLVGRPPAGIVAWIMGSRLRKEATNAGYPEPGRSQVGRICGMIATIIVVVVVVGLLLFVVNRSDSHVEG